MAISAYASASWFLRIVLTVLFCFIVALVSLVITDSTTFLIAKSDQASVSEVLPHLPTSAQTVSHDAEEKDHPIEGEEDQSKQGEIEYEAVFSQDDDNTAKVKKLPDALIIGARKAGTRALITFLALHPQIVTSGDEVQYFNNNDSYAKGLDWYKDQLQATRPDQTLIEKTAEYFHVMYVPERVKKMDPNMKILLIVRDPFTRMVSDYSFLRRFAAANTVEGYDFPEMSHTLHELAIDNKTGSINLQYGGLHRSKYYKFLKNWMLHFPRENIHIISGDRLARENPAIELEKVETFLNLPHVLTEDKFYLDEEKGFYCITSQGCLGKEKGHKQPEFEEEFVTKIKDFLKPLNALFYELAGENYGWD